MNILVTGATGFIGRHLVKELSKTNDNIFCLVRNKARAELLNHLGVKFIYADITQPDSLDENINDKINVIFHCAGYVANKSREMLYKVNVLGTENICRLALKLGVGRMVYLSSVAVVSGNPQVSMVEDLPYTATDIYNQSKIEAEKRVLEYRKKGLMVVILRPCMAYGEDEPHFMKTILSLLKSRLFPLLNHGRNRFHLVYVKNVVDAMIFSLKNDEFLKGSFFIADKEVLTIKEVLQIMAKAIGAKFPYRLPSVMTPFILHFPYIGKKLGFLFKDRVYSIERITSLGFVHSHSTEPSLIRSCQYMFNSKVTRRKYV